MRTLRQIFEEQGENQSDNLFIRIEDNQIVDIFSRKIFEKWQNTIEQ